MKQNVVFLIFFFLATTPLYSREAPGYFINAGNDTIYVRFIVNKDMQQHQYGIPYRDSAGKRQRLLPAEAKEIWWADKEDTVRMLSRNIPYKWIQPGRLGNAYLFLQIIAGERVKVFRLYKSNRLTEIAVGVATTKMVPIPDIKNDFFEVNDGTIMSHKDFKKHIQTLLSDCPEIQSALSKEELTQKELGEIVWRYNTECTQ